MTHASLIVGVLAACLGLVGHGPGAQASPSPSPSRLCLEPLAGVAREAGIPVGLLDAMARVESGRPNTGTGAVEPWPWTVNAAGMPHYFQTEAEAISAVRDLLLTGVTNIDVGCMQISLHWHNAAFTTLDEVFDPVTNITYAADYLSQLHDQYGGTWEAAASRYHSTDTVRRTAYLRRVLSYWRPGDAATDATEAVLGAAMVSADDADSPLARAARAFEAGEMNEALVYYDEAVKARPDDRTARRGRAETLDRLGRTADALAAWRMLLTLDSGNPAATAWLAAYVRALPPAQAVAAAQDLWRIAPNRAAILSLLGETQARAGHPEEALDQYLAAHRADPGAPLPALNVAVALDTAGRPREALPYYARFLDLYRSEPVPLTLPLQSIRDRVSYLRRQANG